MRAHPSRGALVETLDFSAFTSVGLGRSRSCNSRIELLTASTLNACLLACPNVKEVFLSEALELDIDADVLRTLLSRLPRLRALDFCAADTPEFATALLDCLRALTTRTTTEQQQEQEQDGTWYADISHLSLHNCSMLPAEIFTLLLPRLRRLERLDLYNTKVTDSALLALPHSCRLRVLNISQCTNLSASALLSFMTTHPACRTLESLSLLYSWNRTHPFSSAPPQKLDAFIDALPRQSLKILDLAGLDLDMVHLAHLPPGLIELGVHDIDVSTQDLPLREPQSSAFPQEQEQDLATLRAPFAQAERGLLDTVVIDQQQQQRRTPVLRNLQYLLLTHNVISAESRFASILVKCCPKLAILESPGFKTLAKMNASLYVAVPGKGRRDWIQRRDHEPSNIEQHARQWHPRKSNMSLTNGTPRGIYDYYSYRV